MVDNKQKISIYMGTKGKSLSNFLPQKQGLTSFDEHFPRRNFGLRGKQGEQEKKKVIDPEGVNQHSEVKDQNDPKPDHVAAKLAIEHNVGEATIKRDMAFARNVDAITKAVPDARQAILSRDTTLVVRFVNS